MTKTPPFDPPYKTFVKTETGVIVTETLEDGTTRELSGAAFKSLDTIESQISTIKHSRKKPAPVTVSKFSGDKASMYLMVPFSDKELAKSKGAKWDATEKKWYVPHGTDINQFKSWWPESLK